MASIQRVSVLTGFAAAAALMGALPGQASELTIATTAFDQDASATSQPLTLDQLTEASLEGVQFANQTFDLDTAATELPVAEANVDVIEAPVTEAIAQPEVGLEAVEVEAEVAEAEVAEAAELEAEVAEIEAEPIVPNVFVQDEAVVTSAALLLQPGDSLAFLDTPLEGLEVAQNPEVAQVTAPLYRGIAPAYLGVGGNIGIIDSDRSGVGDFGFSVFGKVSFGPRFSVRPALIVTEDDTSLTVPITFNFSPLQLAGFTVAPFVGGGIDISSDAGALVNAGVDIPISQQFTLTAQGNLRVTDDTGFGILLGIAYNLPWFFE